MLDGQPAGEEFDHRARHLDPGQHAQLGIDDVEPKLVIGGVDVGDQTPRQTRQDSRRDPVEILRRAVRGDHQPPSGGDDLVHRVEEFFLRRILAGDKLDIVDQQQIGRAQPALEADRVILANRADELDHELFGRHRNDSSGRGFRQEHLADGVEQMGFAAAGAAMDEQGVEVDALGAGQGLGGGRGDFIGLADHEGVEIITRVESRR